MSDASQLPVYPPTQPPVQPPVQPPSVPVAPPSAEGAPTSALDAQVQAHVEHAEDEAAAAEHNAKLEMARADMAAKKVADAEAAKPELPPPGPIELAEQRARDAVVVTTGPRTVDMVTTEEDRLLRHKEMVKGHLRNAELDMTGGVGQPEIDPATGLPVGHLPEGTQDAPILPS
jgi:hypothetical protein